MANISKQIGFPGVSADVSPEALVIHGERTLHVLSSAVVGGGITQTRYIVNRYVSKLYNNSDPQGDLQAFAVSHGISESFVGLMTAVYLDQARVATLCDSGCTVTAITTAGLGNTTAPGLSRPAALSAGTINIILLVDAQLTPPAMVNAVITATEAKTHILLERGERTPEGYPATGTSTDAVVVACTGRGDPLPYAGPATQVGWLIGRVVRQALGEALR